MAPSQLKRTLLFFYGAGGMKQHDTFAALHITVTIPVLATLPVLCCFNSDKFIMLWKFTKCPWPLAKSIGIAGQRRLRAGGKTPKLAPGSKTRAIC